MTCFLRSRLQACLKKLLIAKRARLVERGRLSELEGLRLVILLLSVFCSGVSCRVMLHRIPINSSSRLMFSAVDISIYWQSLLVAHCMASEIYKHI